MQDRKVVKIQESRRPHCSRFLAILLTCACGNTCMEDRMRASRHLPFLAMAACLAVAYTAYAGLGFTPDMGVASTVVRGALVAGALLSFAWTAVAAARIDALDALPAALRDVRDYLGEITTLKREYNRIQQGLGGTRDEVVAAAAKLLEAHDHLVRSHESNRAADQALILVRQEAVQQAETAEQWRDAAVEHCRALDRALRATGLGEEYAAGVAKIGEDFISLLGSLGISVIRPRTGEPFRDDLHRARANDTTLTGDSLIVASCESWGYQAGAETLEHAQVTVAAVALETAPQPDTDDEAASVADSDDE